MMYWNIFKKTVKILRSNPVSEWLKDRLPQNRAGIYAYFVSIPVF